MINLGPCLVTGGAGFIGSHMVDGIIRNDEKVKVIDNLSSGSISNLSGHLANKTAHFIMADLNTIGEIAKEIDEIETVFHMSAVTRVDQKLTDPDTLYKENIRNTFQLLEWIRKSRSVRQIVFCSSSTVYGEPAVFPTPENYGELLPISLYGASKLACEGLISSYCQLYGIAGFIFRLSNVVGSRSRFGVLNDFIRKLKANLAMLEILGSGHQSKSYIYVDDCISCFLFAISKKTSKKVHVYNVGSKDTIEVFAIARILCEVMHVDNVKLIANDQSMEGRGWAGDVKSMHLDISKLEKLGWSPKYSSKEAITLACNDLLIEELDT